MQRHDTDRYLELFHQDSAGKNRRAMRILELTKTTGNFEVLIERDTLIGALARVFRNDCMKNSRLVNTNVCLFVQFSYYDQFQATLLDHRAMPLKRDESVCCDICKRWIVRKRMYRHMMEVHQFTQDQVDRMKRERQEPRPETLKVSCPICEGKFVDHERLANHCSEEHSRDGANSTEQDYTVYSLQFSTLDEFKVEHNRIYGFKNNVTEL
ncbi:hypothetical protein TELCIR_12745 [Teladorsagia circumcincta]|uniref:C2H2-type domain-containing protein n=1 Tax=Teladorsagia circumcincta TaxID=45464 RepID=A0A2G9U5X5_TELCI|nr:hypothetical protein TELCIR_12745 [Teladorsagia circumcincta]